MEMQTTEKNVHNVDTVIFPEVSGSRHSPLVLVVSTNTRGSAAKWYITHVLHGHSKNPRGSGAKW